MAASHIAGTGVGAIIGVILAALGTRIGLTLDSTTAAALGVACATAGLGLGHAIGQYGLAGIAKVILHGRGQTSVNELFPPATTPAPAPSPPAS